MSRYRSAILIVALAVLLAAGGTIIRMRGRGPVAARELPRVPASIAQASWPIYHGDQALAGVCEDRLPDSPQLVWKKRVGRIAMSSPVMRNGIIYIAGESKVWAMSAVDGQQVWVFDSGVDEDFSDPIVVEDRVFVGSRNGNFYAVDARDGRRLWRTSGFGVIPASPNWATLPDGRQVVLFGDQHYQLHCLDAQNGKELWQFEAGYCVNTTPAVYGQRIFAACSDDKVHILDLKDGKSIADAPIDSYVIASCSVLGGRGYLGDTNGTFYCLDHNGVIWRHSLEGKVVGSTAAVTPDRVVFGAQGAQQVFCLNVADGTEAWTFDAEGDVDASPIICKDRVLIASRSGRLYILSLANGAVIWKYDVGQSLSGTPMVARGVIVVGGDDGWVYCFAGKN
jgi:outer membrane protein assembly factor BamB